MHKQFQELLHEYKREAFKVEHDKKSIEQITRETVAIAEDVLRQKYQYHFHKLPNADRAEIINMISNYTREAVLPPIVEKLVQRQVTQEHRMDKMVKLIERMLEVLSEQQAGKAPAGMS
jgi:hypothetical protein